MAKLACHSRRDSLAAGQEGKSKLRALLGVLACLCLGGCWGSEERFFGPEDWARLAVDGEFRVETLRAEDGARTARIRARPDGLIEIVPSGRGGRTAETLRLGFIPIRGGSGEFYLAVDRTEPGKSDGDLYVIAKVAGGSIELYSPDCLGTPPIEGVERADGLSGELCEFETEEALFEAALMAERFLSEPHIVTVSPFTKFEKIDPDSGAGPVEE